VAYGNGYWVAVGAAGQVRYATDPTGTWSAASSPGFGLDDVHGVAYGNGYWVAAGSAARLRYATDPTGTWSAVAAHGFSGTDVVFRVAYGGGHWVAAGFDPYIQYAADPTGTWATPSSVGFAAGASNGVRGLAFAGATAVYLTDTASDIADQGTVEKKAWTTRGTG
jgi:hypothetical protein